MKIRNLIDLQISVSLTTTFTLSSWTNRFLIPALKYHDDFFFCGIKDQPLPAFIMSHVIKKWEILVFYSPHTEQRSDPLAQNNFRLLRLDKVVGRSMSSILPEVRCPLQVALPLH